MGSWVQAQKQADLASAEARTNQKFRDYKQHRGRLGYGVDSTAEIPSSNPHGAFEQREAGEKREITRALDIRHGSKDTPLDIALLRMMEVRNKAIQEHHNTRGNEIAVNRLMNDFGRNKAFAMLDAQREKLSADKDLTQVRRFNREFGERTSAPHTHAGNPPHGLHATRLTTIANSQPQSAFSKS